MKTINDYAELVKEKHALNETIAPVEADETDASKAYQVGEQLILSGILYDVIAPISQHDIITTTGSGANIAPAGPISAKIQTLTQEVDTIVNDLSAKNLLDIETWLTSVGRTFTKDGDTYATSTGGISYGTPFAFAEKDIDVTLSGIITNNTSGDARVEVLNSSNEMVARIRENTTYASGKGCKVRLNWSTDGNFSIEKPMIRPASIEDNTYVPYAKTNRELTEDTNAIEPMLNVLGAKNLIHITPKTEIVRGLTFTVNNKGEVSIIGTHTAQSGTTGFNIFDSPLDAGKYKFSVEGNLLGTCIVACHDEPSGVGNYKTLCTLGVTSTEIEFIYTEEDKAQYPYIWVQLGVYYTQVNVNTVYKPMIRPSSIIDSSFVPPAMTNRELTEKVTSLAYSNVKGVEFMVVNNRLLITLFTDDAKSNGLRIDFNGNDNVIQLNTITNGTQEGHNRVSFPVIT